MIILEEQVYAAAKAAFSEVLAAHPEETFYTFGLFTDGSLQFLRPVANTEEALTATVKRYKETVDPKYGCTSTRNGMRWSYGDWGFFTIDGNHFDEINRTLCANFDSYGNNDKWAANRDQSWDAMIAGFLRLERENFFRTGAARSKITLLIVGDLPGKLMNECARYLNPPDVAARYIGWNCDAEDSE